MNLPTGVDPHERRYLLGLLATGLSGASLAAAPARPLRVVATFSILADMVRQTAGDVVQLHTLVGPDADAHAYQPSPLDARRLAEADLVVVNGFGFEGWLDRLVQASGFRGRLVTATAGIEPRRVHGMPDPHAWQDLRNGERYMQTIAAALATALPHAASLLLQRSADLRQRTLALHRQVKARFAALPAARRRVITSHDAFGYFGAAYGVEFLAPQGIGTESEPSAAAVAALIRQVRSQQVRALFVENISDPRLLQRIAQEAGVQLGGRLYSDALSAPGTAAGTYLGMMTHNADTIAAALSS